MSGLVKLAGERIHTRTTEFWCSTTCARLSE